MRNVKGYLTAAVLALSAAGCVETMDSGYPGTSYGYGNGYYAERGYQRPVVNNYYTTYTPAPVVVTQTRVVTPPPQRVANREQHHVNPPPATNNTR